jgi:hypothetical protein
MMNDALKLSVLEPFGVGGNRACYVHPEDASKCVKVLLPHRNAERKRAKAVGLKRYRSLKYFDDNLRELCTYHEIENAYGDEIWSHLPKCYGMVSTDLGDGLISDLVRDFDGAISGTLKDRLNESGNTAYFRRGVDDFLNFFRVTRLPSRDLLLHNLVGQIVDADGTLKIHVIDGFGSADFIPLASWSKHLAKRKVERKISKFMAKIEDFTTKYNIPYYA